MTYNLSLCVLVRNVTHVMGQLKTLLRNFLKSGTWEPSRDIFD